MAPRVLLMAVLPFMVSAFRRASQDQRAAGRQGNLVAGDDPCGHSAEVCNSPDPATPAFFTRECLDGGHGCRAFGHTCCRHCGFDPFREIPCPDLLKAIDTSAPDEAVFPRRHDHRVPHTHTEVSGPKMTNKFWANWVVAEGVNFPIYPMPYTLKWGHSAGAPPKLMVSHGEPVHNYGPQGEKIRFYFHPVISEFAIGAVEASSPESAFTIVDEDLFGVQVEVRGQGQAKITFPIFSGMAFVSGLFTGGFTPQITSDRAIIEVQRVRDGIFVFKNNGGMEFRVYVLTDQGAFVDSSYDFSQQGVLNKALEGWVRVAEVVEASDTEVLDAHAQAVLVGADVDVQNGGRVGYAFKKAGAQDVPILHWAYAHHVALMEPAPQRVLPTKIKSSTKGEMHGVEGDAWALRADLAEASRLGFLPAGEPRADHVALLSHETEGALEDFEKTWQSEMLRGGYYFSGKGFQKIGMICLLAEKFFGATDQRTQRCASLLARGFRCLYEPTPECGHAMPGMYYDEQWGGVVTREGYTDDGCLGGADFGNACYNDHHYHYGYFVVSGAILAKISPAHRSDTKFVQFVNMLIRDTTNPSSQDTYFPRFRSFDWFDLHSWSHGLPASPDGKDQESTSEEVNLLWGIHLWGGLVGDSALQQLGTTMLALASVTIREFFLMKRDNPHHHPDFAKNHATGIYFQNKIDYATWFGDKAEYIHGIQMMPLSPALLLTRTADFCREEWADNLANLELSPTDPWTSVILSGSLAIIEPYQAYSKLASIEPENYDDGLTKVWALYWASAQIK